MSVKKHAFSRKEGVTKKLAILTVNFHLKKFIGGKRG